METKTENLWELRLDLRCGGRTWDMPRREESRRICVFRDTGVSVPGAADPWYDRWGTDHAEGHDDELDAFATAVEADISARKRFCSRAEMIAGVEFRKKTAADDPDADDWECYWHKSSPVRRRNQTWEAEAWVSVYPANSSDASQPPTII